MSKQTYDFERAAAFFRDRLDFTTGTHELDLLLKDESKAARYQVVDVRAADDYAKGHIPGAINLPMPKWENRRHVEATLRQDATIYLYCYSPTCHLAALAAASLSKAGYRVVEMEGGWSSWVEGGYPVEEPAPAARTA